MKKFRTLQLSPVRKFSFVYGGVSSKCFYKKNKAATAKRLLLMGQGVRQVARIAGLNKTTIIRLKKAIGLATKKDTLASGATRYHAEFPKQPWEKPGICACGCGQQTRQVVYDDKRLGLEAGNFYRFIGGHQWKLRRTLVKPPGWISSHDVLKERDRVRIEIAEAAKKIGKIKETPTFDDLRNEFGGSIVVLGKEINNQGISRMLTTASWLVTGIPKVIVPPRIRPVQLPEISEFYPFNISTGNQQHELLLAVHEAVPKGLVHNQARADICQDLLLALLSNEITLQGLRLAVPKYIKKYFAMFNHRLLSLDAPRSSESDSTLYDLISASNSGELYGIVKGGVNWSSR